MWSQVQAELYPHPGPTWFSHSDLRKGEKMEAMVILGIIQILIATAHLVVDILS